MLNNSEGVSMASIVFSTVNLLLERRLSSNTSEFRRRIASLEILFVTAVLSFCGILLRSKSCNSSKSSLFPFPERAQTDRSLRLSFLERSPSLMLISSTVSPSFSATFSKVSIVSRLLLLAIFSKTASSLKLKS